MRRFLSVLAALSFLFVAHGCGQSGPLYIPGNPSRIEHPPPPDDSTAEEESEENGDSDDGDKE